MASPTPSDRHTSSAGNELRPILAALERMHGGELWHWTPSTPPFEIMVGAVLVQRTAWTNAERALDRLRAADLLSPEAILRLSRERLEQHLFPAGYYRSKARKLLALASAISECGGLEPFLAGPPSELRLRLLRVWGIGPETADAIILYAAHKPAFVVDAYTRRLFRRLGLGPTNDSYETWQTWFAAQLPADADLWAKLHALVVLHAKRRCRKRSPDCEGCLLRDRCPAAATFTAARLLP